jgi:hypothetical protein
MAQVVELCLAHSNTSTVPLHTKKKKKKELRFLKLSCEQKCVMTSSAHTHWWLDQYGNVSLRPRVS